MTMKMLPEDRSRVVSFTVQPPLYRTLKRIKASTGLSVSEIVRQALRVHYGHTWIDEISSSYRETLHKTQAMWRSGRLQDGSAWSAEDPDEGESDK